MVIKVFRPNVSVKGRLRLAYPPEGDDRYMISPDKPQKGFHLYALGRFERCYWGHLGCDFGGLRGHVECKQ